MSNLDIKDNEIIASDSVSSGPEQARYAVGKGWCVRGSGSSVPQFTKYLQIDLLEPYNITELWLQGAPNRAYSYGQLFRLEYKRNNNDSFKTYNNENGKIVSVSNVSLSQPVYSEKSILLQPHIIRKLQLQGAEKSCLNLTLGAITFNPPVKKHKP